MPIQHSPTSWQKNAIDFLTQNGIELDLEKLFYKDEYRRYISRYGLPVVKRTVQENSILEDSIIKTLETYEPVTSKEVVEILSIEFNLIIDLSTVDTKLNEMRSEYRVIRDESFNWKLV